MNENSLRTEETLPSRECTDCPKEACLEFTVVDYWGDPVDSPTQFTLDGKPVRPNTPITPLTPGKHLLKALDGEVQLPYLPARVGPSPALKKAHQEGKNYVHASNTQLWEQVSLRASVDECHKHLIEVNLGLDYCILMAFLDNHSGGLHGTGHAGALIIDGKNQQGTYTDFGPYEGGLGIVRNIPQGDILLTGQYGKIIENYLGVVFDEINTLYGSSIISQKSCEHPELLNGPMHENFGEHSLSPGFAVNGIIAWAMFALPAGAYSRMLKYTQDTEAKMSKLRNVNKSGYNFIFNCMSYAVSVLDIGMGHPHPVGTINIFDHPNAHIGIYIEKAHEHGYFDNRMLLGEPDAACNQPQKCIPGIRQRERVIWAIFDNIGL